MPQIGQVIPSHFNPAIVFASYVASFCGTYLTVELLHRRGTGVHNVRSWFETLGCAIALGVVGIWCMHFIGNRAIVLGDGEPGLQLVYSPGYSTLSVFLPVIGLNIAFAAAEYPAQSKVLHWIALTCTGIFAGLSIVGMHYIGNFGVSNYKLEYVPAYLAASVIIAIGDTLTVLILFYTLREKWISSGWKRIFCAILLSGGISAMHFTASTKCIYRFQKFNAPAAIRSRDVQVIVAGLLCGAAGIIVLCVLFFTRYRAKVLKRSSQKVMLACAFYDPSGRILVTTEGVLPAKEITDKYNHRTFNEDFDNAHAAFHWIFRVTRHWSSVTDLIPKMRRHLGAQVPEKGDDSPPSSCGSSTIYDPDTYNDYDKIFREQFCIAAASLASSMHLHLEDMGVLYDDIVETGTINTDEKVARRSIFGPAKESQDLEIASRPSLFGKGQLLFLTRRLNPTETDRLLNAGFKFAGSQQVSRNIATTMQIPLAALEFHLSGIKRYVDNLTLLQKYGTWISCLALIPKASSKGFDIAVRKYEQDQLPDAQLLDFEPLQWQADFLQRLHDKTPSECTLFLEDRDRKGSPRSSEEQQFALNVMQSIHKLGEDLPAACFQNARFYGRPVYAHYSQALHDRAPVTTLYSFVGYADLHTSTKACPGVARVPESFFRVRQKCYPGSLNHVALANVIHREFGSLQGHRSKRNEPNAMKKFSKQLSTVSTNKIGGASLHPHSRRPSIFRSHSDIRKDPSSDERELVDGHEITTPGTERENPWGGILVNSETVVHSDSKSDDITDDKSIGLEMSMNTAVGTFKEELTWVDELFDYARTITPSKVGF